MLKGKCVYTLLECFVHIFFFANFVAIILSNLQVFANCKKQKSWNQYMKFKITSHV